MPELWAQRRRLPTPGENPMVILWSLAPLLADAQSGRHRLPPCMSCTCSRNPVLLQATAVSALCMCSCLCNKLSHQLSRSDCETPSFECCRSHASSTTYTGGPTAGSKDQSVCRPEHILLCSSSASLGCSIPVPCGLPTVPSQMCWACQLTAWASYSVPVLGCFADDAVPNVLGLLPDCLGRHLPADDTLHVTDISLAVTY